MGQSKSLQLPLGPHFYISSFDKNISSLKRAVSEPTRVLKITHEPKLSVTIHARNKPRSSLSKFHKRAFNLT